VRQTLLTIDRIHPCPSQLLTCLRRIGSLILFAAAIWVILWIDDRPALRKAEATCNGDRCGCARQTVRADFPKQSRRLDARVFCQFSRSCLDQLS
jgi:hypothetical protein